jgi:dienelactone hydrolase
MAPDRRSTVAWFGLLLAVGALVLAIPALDVARGTAFVVRAADLKNVWADRLAQWTVHAFDVQDLELPSRHGPVRARLYRSAPRDRRLVLLTAGVHAQGIDEPRLVELAQDFARTGVTVLTPELPDLLEYRITPRLPDLIEDAIDWAARQPAVDTKVGVVGISFSGGLSVVAAGRASVRDRVKYVVSFGGHGDLERTMRYLCTGREPDGSFRTPHDYGVVVILLNAAHVMVPPEQVEPLRHGIRIFLQASHVDMVNHQAAREIFAQAVAFEASLPEPAATLLHYVNTRDVGRLGPLLLPHVAQATTDPSLSPERSPAPLASVYLLHGADDNVIPAAESAVLAASLRRRGTRVTLLRSPLITHAEVDRTPRVRDVWHLLAFWASVLSQ